MIVGNSCRSSLLWDFAKNSQTGVRREVWKIKLTFLTFIFCWSFWVNQGFLRFLWMHVLLFLWYRHVKHLTLFCNVITWGQVFVQITKFVKLCDLFQDDLRKEDFSTMSAQLLYKMIKSKTEYPLHKAIKVEREDVVFLYLIEMDSQVSLSLKPWK